MSLFLIFFGLVYDQVFGNKGSSSFKSANNEFYDTWLPIYINKEHFEKNKTTILNYFSILKFGNFGLKEYDFHPQYIFEIMPKILAEMIKKMGDENISSSLIKCFFQNVLMFKKLEKEYKNIFMKYQKYFTRIKINNFIKENKSIDIKNEILELLILFYFSDNKINEDIKQKFVKYIIKLKNLFFLNLFESKIYVTFKDQNIFIKDLKKNKLFYKIVDIIFIDSDYLILSQEQSLLNLSEILRNKIIKQMNANFKELYMKLDYKIKQKIKKILLNELNFSSYFNNEDYYSHNDYSQRMFISNSEFSSKFSDYILIFNSIKEKVLDKRFLDELENNYGIYLNNEAFIEELNEIKKNYKKIDNIMKYFLCNNNNFNTIKNTFLFGFKDYIPYHFSFYDDYRYSSLVYNNSYETDIYPFVTINKLENKKILRISSTLKTLMDKDKVNYKNKIFSKQKEIIMDKRIKKFKRENIKKSYNKNYNKALQRYNYKQYR